MRRLTAAVVGVVLASSGVALAAPYGASGCGLGSVLLGDQKGIIQVLGATLNGLFANQSFGITFGTLNCGEASVKGVAQNTKIYIEANREVVAKDISRGQGDTIIGLAAIAGCRDSSQVGATLQKNYERIFPTAQVESEQVTHAILETLREDPALACQQVI